MTRVTDLEQRACKQQRQANACSRGGATRELGSWGAWRRQSQLGDRLHRGTGKDKATLWACPSRKKRESPSKCFLFWKGNTWPLSDHRLHSHGSPSALRCTTRGNQGS